MGNSKRFDFFARFHQIDNNHISVECGQKLYFYVPLPVRSRHSKNKILNYN
jgi:hypothetical protein